MKEGSGLSTPHCCVIITSCVRCMRFVTLFASFRLSRSISLLHHNMFLCSGSLPRSSVPSSTTPVTSLLDDSIIATPSSLASSSSSTTRMSVTGGNSGSIGSSRSNSGSEFSGEQDETSRHSSDR